MPVNFPGGLDALANPTPTTLRNDPGFSLAGQIATLNDIAEAVQAKLGIGASVPGAAAAVLRRTGSGASAWGQVTAADLAAGAAGITKLGEYAADGTSPLMFISGIPGTYKRLTVQWIGRVTNAGAGIQVGVNFEASPSAGAYYWQRLYANAGTPGANESLGAAAAYIAIGTVAAAASPAGLFSSGLVSLPDYANSAAHKMVECQSASIFTTAAAGMIHDNFVGAFYSFGALTLVRVIVPTGGNWAVGSKIALYGWQ